MTQFSAEWWLVVSMWSIPVVVFALIAWAVTEPKRTMRRRLQAQVHRDMPSPDDGRNLRRYLRRGMGDDG